MHIAAYGWDHEPWQGRFYPDDLPAAWRLGYYANEFRSVIVPAAHWVSADRDAIRAWCGEVTADFRFFPELPPGGIEVDRADAFAAHLGGLVPGPSVQAGALAMPGQRPLAVGYCPSDPVAPRELRRLIDQLVAAAAGDSALLWCGDGPHVPELMRAARTIIELSGIGEG